MAYIGVITHLLTIDPNFQRDIPAVPEQKCFIDCSLITPYTKLQDVELLGVSNPFSCKNRIRFVNKKPLDFPGSRLRSQRWVGLHVPLYNMGFVGPFRIKTTTIKLQINHRPILQMIKQSKFTLCSHGVP